MIRNLKSELAPTGFYFTGRFADWEYYNMDVAMGVAMDLCHMI
jgi:UDP-galactopyranose mutase